MYKAELVCTTEEQDFQFYFNLTHLYSHPAGGYRRRQRSSNICKEFTGQGPNEQICRLCGCIISYLQF